LSAATVPDLRSPAILAGRIPATAMNGRVTPGRPRGRPTTGSQLGHPPPPLRFQRSVGDGRVQCGVELAVQRRHRVAEHISGGAVERDSACPGEGLR
jgi:hypothetical protein